MVSRARRCAAGFRSDHQPVGVCRTRVCFQPSTRLSSFSYLHQPKCVSFQSFCLCVSIRTLDLHLGTFYAVAVPRKAVSGCFAKRAITSTLESKKGVRAKIIDL